MLAFLIFAATEPVAADAEAPLRIDILVPPACERQDSPSTSDEIVVCAERERQDARRLQRVENGSGSALPKAEIALGENASFAAETESADLGMVRSQRAMVRFKLKL